MATALRFFFLLFIVVLSWLLETFSKKKRERQRAKSFIAKIEKK